MTSTERILGQGQALVRALEVLDTIQPTGPIERRRGRVHIVHPPWREKSEHNVEIIEDVRARFREAVVFNQMLCERYRGYPGSFEFERQMDSLFRSDRSLGAWMDAQHQEAIETMNSMLEENEASAASGY